MSDQIEGVVQKWLDSGETEEGYLIDAPQPPKKVSIVKAIGMVIVTESEPGVRYYVLYERLFPLHGTPEDVVNLVTSIVPID